MRKPKELPILLDERDVKRLLGRVPRSLRNCVMFDPKGRKLFSRKEVMELCREKSRSRGQGLTLGLSVGGLGLTHADAGSSLPEAPVGAVSWFLSSLQNQDANV